MKIIQADNHCHICKKYYPDPISFLNDLKSNSHLEYISSIGVNFENNNELLNLKKDFNNTFLKIGCGLHPEEVITLGKLYNQELDRVILQIKKNSENIDIIGEIGIDFFYPNSREFEKEQKDAFRKLIKLSLELNKPVSIHARESFPEIMEIIDEEIKSQKEFHGYIHCFTGDFEQGMFFIEKGFKLGLSGLITFKKNQELRDTIKELQEFYFDKDFNELFGLETDSPYLTPEPIRSETNSPKNIKIIAEYIENL